MMNVFSPKESVAITRSSDKLRLVQLLARQSTGLPVTGFAHNPDDIEDLISTVGGAPLVIKLLEGTQGSAWCLQKHIRLQKVLFRHSWG